MFKCRELGHQSLDSRKKVLMLEEVKYEDGEPVFYQLSNEEVGGNFE